MPKLTKARAFKIVYDELSKVDMFMGKFDAKNGNDKFMSGVQTVMEAVAYGVSEDMQWAYTDIFLANWLNSKEKEDEPQELNCRNKQYYSSCEYANKCHPIVCFKAFDELKERLKDEPQTDCAWK